MYVTRAPIVASRLINLQYGRVWRVAVNFGRIENLFDEQYETIFRYGQPGRAVFGGVRFRM